MDKNSESIVSRRLAGALAVFSAVVALQFAVADARAAQEGAAAADSTKTVLITGSNRGIGLAFARHYAAASDANWRVIATCRRPEQAEALKALAAERGNIEIVMLDVTREDHILSLVERYAGQPIDLLINNAAILGPPPDQSLGGLDYDQSRA